MEVAGYDIALLIIRVGLGATLAAHGLNKFFGGGRISGAAGWFASIGMRPGKFQAVLAASTEIGAGVLFAAGFLTSFAAAGFVGLMVVAILLVHIRNGFLITSGGSEYTFVLALVPSALTILGPGKWSVDQLIKVGNDEMPLHTYFDSWLGLIISAGGGTLVALLVLAIFYRKPAPVAEESAPEPEPRPHR